MKLIQFLLAAQLSVVQQIEQLPSTGAASRLAASLLRETRGSAKAAVEAWRNGTPKSRQNARAVLNDMEEAALNPLLTLDAKLSADDQAWRMTMVVETVGNLRRDAARMLGSQLGNREVAPVPLPEPPRRVCDDAYLLMNQLAAENPESQDVLLRAREFLRLSEAARDAEIRRARRSAAWRALRR